MQVASVSFRSYALDLWGYGDTAQKPENYTIEKQAELIQRFLAEMGIGKVALVGHGLGALVGMKFAFENPSSVDRLMAIGCPIKSEAISPRLTTDTSTVLVDWLSNRTPESTSALTDASKADSKAASVSINSFSPDLFSLFRTSNIPTLLVYGEKDLAITTPSEEDATSTLVHQLTLETSGHFPMLDEPIQFNRLVTDFLTLESGASPRELELKEEWKRRVR